MFHETKNVSFDITKALGTVKRDETRIEPLESTIGQRIDFSKNRFTRPNTYDWMSSSIVENLNSQISRLGLLKDSDQIDFAYPEKKVEMISEKWKQFLDKKSTEAIDFFSQKASEIEGVEESILCGKDDNYTLITLVRTKDAEDEKKIYDIEYDILKKFGKINIDFLVLPFKDVIKIASKNGIPLFKREWGL